MSDSQAANTYLRTKVMTASPEELRLLLIDGAIKFARQAREGLEKKDFEQSFNGFSQCRAIVLELLNTIRPEPDPALAAHVQSLYAFMYGELVNASMEKSAARVDSVLELLSYERETWVMLMNQLAEERRAGATGAEPDDQKPATPPAPGGGRGTSLSLSA